MIVLYNCYLCVSHLRAFFFVFSRRHSYQVSLYLTFQHYIRKQIHKKTIMSKPIDLTRLKIRYITPRLQKTVVDIYYGSLSPK